MICGRGGASSSSLQANLYTNQESEGSLGICYHNVRNKKMTPRRKEIWRSLKTIRVLESGRYYEREEVAVEGATAFFSAVRLSIRSRISKRMDGFGKSLSTRVTRQNSSCIFWITWRLFDSFGYSDDLKLRRRERPHQFLIHAS